MINRCESIRYPSISPGEQVWAGEPAITLDVSLDQGMLDVRQVTSPHYRWPFFAQGCLLSLALSFSKLKVQSIVLSPCRGLADACNTPANEAMPRRPWSRGAVVSPEKTTMRPKANEKKMEIMKACCGRVRMKGIRGWAAMSATYLRSLLSI